MLVALPGALPKTAGYDVLDNWEMDIDSEARRVVYVGASRAVRLLAIGAGNHAARIEALLAAHEVAFEAR